MIIFPTIFAFFEPDTFVNFLVLLLLVLMGWSILNSVKLIHEMIKRHKSNFNRSSKKYDLLMRRKMKTAVSSEKGHVYK
jgi:hypothetical protein